MRLAEVAVPTNAGTVDGVFLRLVALHKGRDLLARALRTVSAPLASRCVPAVSINCYQVAPFMIHKT